MKKLILIWGLAVAAVTLTSTKEPKSRCQHIDSWGKYDCYYEAMYNSPFCSIHAYHNKK